MFSCLALGFRTLTSEISSRSSLAKHVIRTFPTSRRDFLNPYLDYHRPCAQADSRDRCQGPQARSLHALSDSAGDPARAAQYLRPGISVNVLQRIACALSDTDAAQPIC